ncbi:MAG: xanthine dehydrogenase family protein subunit M [Actinomycetota bacterium]|nr:xanthine dehydrogenase family protein subunit M [Actinomycetota bacterium]
MVIAHDFAYVKPATLDDAVQALAEGGPGARVLAGGTDLVAGMRDDLLDPDLVIDIKGIAGLSEITHDDDALHLGALVTVGDVQESEAVAHLAPVLIEMADVFASNGIRHRATIAGNICSAVPSCDAGPVLLAYEATIDVVGPAGVRTIPIGEWFVGLRVTALEPGEIVTRITIPRVEHGGAFLKLARYDGEDLAQASVAVLELTGDHRRVAFGAVGPVPARASRIEARLEGSPLDDVGIAEVKALVASEIAPITDLRATREYREHMCRVMLERGLAAAATRFCGNGPPYPTRLV